MTWRVLLVCLALGGGGGAVAGSILREVYEGIPGVNVSDLTSAATYPNNPTSTNLITDLFESPTDVLENYGQRLSGFIIPPVSGNYTFWIASDDGGELWLSTDDTVANKRLIASVVSWTPSRQWSWEGNQQSAAINLTAGKAYYVAALMKEGGGGDNLAVRWLRPDGLDEGPIPATYLLPWGTAFTAPVITSQPADTAAVEGQAATFTVGISGTTPAVVQWRRNGVNIPGATDTTLRYSPVAMADQGALFSAFLTNSIGATNTRSAVLTVTADTTRPALGSALNFGRTTLQAVFSEAVATASATAPSNYTLSGGVVVSAAAFGADTRTILLTTTAMTYGQSYTLTVNNVQDRAAVPNTIAAGSTLVFQAVEYAPVDIGGSGVAGGSVPVSGGFDVSGAGAEIGGTSDQFQFSYQQVTGDFDLQARVSRLTITHPYAQAGLMVRDSLAANARFGGIFVSSAQLGAFFESRSSAGAASATTTLNSRFPVNYPQAWLRLRRAGATLYGFASLDGQTWTQLGTVSLSGLASTVYFGMAVTSADPAKAAVAGFRDLGGVSSTTTGGYVPEHEPLGPSSRRTGLTFSEIMYHPRARADLKNLEFIEIYNGRSTPEDLSGWRISGDVDYVFPAGFELPAGAFVVVAGAPADLQSVYGITNVLGPFSNTNRLSNGGGTLRLRNASDAIRLEVNYNDSGTWAVAADGAGHSLVLANPSYGEADPRAWAASERIGGSPGEVDAVYPAPQRAVVINEFLAHTDLPQVDAVELYNHSNVDVDLGGCVLTDDITTNLYRFPSPTTIPARGYLALDANQLGFNLDAAGERIFLVNSNATRVLDAIQFGAQANGVSSGRCPDGSRTIRRLDHPTFGAANSGWKLESIVINEIMYNPISGDADDEFVELYNRGAAAVDLSGWTLSDAVSFKFPPNTTLSAGAFLVIGRNQQRLLTNYPGVLSLSNTLGDYSGSLGNGGDRVVLRMPDDLVSTNVPAVTNSIHIAVAEVVYGAGGRWGTYADGGGSSLELTDPAADPLQPDSWRDSNETGKSTWTQVTQSTALDNGNTGYSMDRLFIGLMGPGESLIDDVSVSSSSGGANLVSNAGFESGTAGWSFFGNHSVSTVDAGAGYTGSALHLRTTGDTDTGPNTVRTALAGGLANGGTAYFSARVRWLAGWPEVLFRLHGNYGEFPVRLPVPTNLGSPGQPNSRLVANAGPAIYDVTHYPPVPQNGESVLVTCRVSDSQSLASLNLRYRNDSTSGTLLTVAFSDSGTGGDRVAGDGLYTATLPAQGAGTTLAFRIEARDDAGSPATRLFPSDAPTRECLVRWADPLPFGNFAHYHIWQTVAVQNAWNSSGGLNNTWRNATLVYNNSRVIYNVGCRDKGSPYHSGYGDIACTVPPDDRLLGATDRVLASIGNGGNDDPTSIRSQLASWIAQQIGVPYLHSQYIFVYRNGGLFRSIMEDLEQPNHDHAESWFPDASAGDLYKIAVWFEFNDDNAGFGATSATIQNFTTTGGAKKLARYRWNWQRRSNDGLASNYTNLLDLVTVINASDSSYVSRLSSVADMEQWMRVMVYDYSMGNWDAWSYSVGQNMYIYKPDGQRWTLMPWDIDFTLGLGDGTGGALWGGQDPVISRVYATPTFQRMLWRGYQDVVSGPYVQANYGPQIEERRSLLLRNGVAGLQGGNAITNYIEGRRSYIQGQINANNASTFAITSNGGNNFTSGNASVALAGTAPFSAAVIEVNGVPYPATWTDIRTFSVSVPLTQATNILTLTARDRRGNLIPGYTDTITVTYTGAIQRVQDYVTINEVQYNGVGSGTSFVELFNRSTTTPFDLSGFRLDGVGYTFPEGSILAPNSYLVLAEDRVGFAAAYGGTLVVFDQFAGTLDNGGEYLALVKPGATPAEDLVVSDVRYNDKLPWPVTADGQGPSLQLIDPAQDEYRVGNWAVTATTNDVNRATPGRANSVVSTLPAFPLIWINEVLPNNLNGATDAAGEREPWIELYNSGTSGLDISACYLTDAYTNLTKWQFPGGTTIPAQGFLTVWADGQSSAVDPGRPHTNFRLNPTNGSVALVRFQGSPAAPAVMDYVNYTVLTPDRAFGSYPDGQPRNRRLLYYPTPGATNDPATPPLQVTINEWMASNTSTHADPADGKFDDWFELYNAGTNLVDLASYSLAGNLTNTARFRIPNGYMIPPGGFLVVWADNDTGQNVSTNADLHVDFKLSASGESIALFDPNGVLLDSVTFSTQAVDVAQGRFPDGAGLPAVVLDLPSPGAPNIVDGANLPPVVTVPAATNVAEGGVLTFKATATGPEAGQILTFSLGATAPAGATIDDATGQVAWTPTEAQGPGTYAITVRATDDGAPQRTGSAQVVVTVTEVNRAPVIETVTDRSVNEGALLAFSVVASDPDVPANGLSFSLEPGAPAGMTVDAATGEVRWTPEELQGPAVYTVGVRVTDDGAPAMSAVVSFHVTVVEVNNPPDMPLINPQSVAELSVFTYTVQATDPDNPPVALYFGFDQAPTGAQINPATGVITWTPTEVQGPGNALFVVRATENVVGGLSSTRTFSVTVTEVNQSPTLAPIANQTVKAGDTVAVSFVGTDPDVPAQTLLYGLDGVVPAGATVDSGTGRFSWVVSPDAPASTNVITARVIDSMGYDALQSFTVVVVPGFRVVINEIMHHPKAANGAYVELFNVSSNATYDLSGLVLAGKNLSYTFAAGTTLGPRSFLCVAANPTAFASAYGGALRNVGPWTGGFTFPDTLELRQGTNVLDTVSFDASAPWPVAANGSGGSLQLLDPTRDNNRLGNWVALTTNGPVSTPQWTYVTATGTGGDPRLYLYLQSAGEICLDDIRVVEGSTPGVGANLLVNGDFETALSTGWTVTANTAGSGLSTTTRHAGASGLRLACAAAGTTQGDSIWQSVPGLTAGSQYTLSFWYLPTTNSALLTVRFSGGWIRVDQNILWQPGLSGSMLTPGAANDVGRSLSEFPTLRLNEVQPRNTTGITDRVGDRDPWVEILNTGLVPVSLDGLALSDDPAALLKSPFPSGMSIPAGGYLVVFADGEPVESSATEFHTNFRLPATSGSPWWVALTRDQSGTAAVVDYLAGVVPGEDQSIGRAPDGTAEPGVLLSTASPGAPNVSVVEPPEITGAATTSGGVTTLTWTTVAGRSYRVDYQGILDPLQPWTSLQTLVASGASLSFQDTTAAGQSQRFYRIVLLP